MASFKNTYKREATQGIARLTTMPPLVEKDLTSLPDPVQKYLRYTGATRGNKTMNTLTGYVIGVAIVLALASLALLRYMGIKCLPLFVYVIGVAVVWVVILGVAWFIGGPARFNTFALVCLGFALGMLAMYIAVHVYKT